MSKGQGRNIVIKFTDDITTEDIGANKSAFKVSGKEYKYVNGPLLDKEYAIDKVERYGIVPIWNIEEELQLSKSDIPIGVLYHNVTSEGSGIAHSVFSSSYPLAAAFDGITNHDGWSASGTIGRWIGLDFNNNPKIISKFRAFSYQMRFRGFIFEASNNSSDWVILTTGELNNSRTWDEFDFENDIAYRYYRLRCTSVYTGSNVSLSELEMYSKKMVFEYAESESTIYNLGGLTGEYRIRWLEIKPTGTDIIIEYTTGEIQGQWQEVSNGDVITSDTNLWFRITLETTDTSVTPTLQDLWIEEPDVPQDKIRIVMDEFSRFPTVEGNLTVEYDASVGNLAGRGGFVESFVEVFTPTDLVPEPNPNQQETIEVAPVELTVDLLPVEYVGAYNEETISVAPVELTVELIHTSIINP